MNALLCSGHWVWRGVIGAADPSVDAARSDALSVLEHHFAGPGWCAEYFDGQVFTGRLAAPTWGHAGGAEARRHARPWALVSAAGVAVSRVAIESLPAVARSRSHVYATSSAP